MVGRVRPLVETQLEVLLSRDREGRLVATRDPTARVAPRLFVSRSAEGNIWATRSDLDPELAKELHRLCATEPRLVKPAPETMPICRKRIIELLRPVAAEYRGPCFVLPDGLPLDARAREIAVDERLNWPNAFPWLAEEFEAIAPVAIAFEGGQAASICHSPRGHTEHAAEAGVETLPEFRGRGLATAAVACWARAVQHAGKLALYSTAWENEASQGVARRLSARIYAENWHVT